jgi:HAD superfamily hydrolase (TIGR01509 family)
VPLTAVLFDFHGTLAQVEEPTEWVAKAAAACGVDLVAHEAPELAKALVAAGRAGGPLPDAVPPHLADVWERRDLAADAHRDAYTGLAASIPCGIDGLPAALYERLLRPDGWRLYADTVPVLRRLRRAGVAVAMVSNIGFDLRPMAAALGIADLVDAYALSCEVGACKPAPEIFRAALDELGVAPRDALMVGDTPADAGAAAIGCRCLILPASPPEAVHGLAAVLGLLGPSRDLGNPGLVFEP